MSFVAISHFLGNNYGFLFGKFLTFSLKRGKKTLFYQIIVASIDVRQSYFAVWSQIDFCHNLHT